MPVADALDVPARSVRLDVGARSRDKLLRVEADDGAALADRVQHLPKNGHPG